MVRNILKKKKIRKNMIKERRNNNKIIKKGGYRGKNYYLKIYMYVVFFFISPKSYGRYLKKK